MRNFWIAVVLLFLSGTAAQAARTWIFFDELPRSGAFAGTERAALRLQKAGLDPAATVNQSVDPAWLAELRSEGAVIHNVSRWLRAVSIADDPAVTARLQARWPVRDVRPVLTLTRPLPPVVEKQSPWIDRSTIYGNSWTQLAQMGIPTLHEMGYTGSGVFIGMLDSGWQLNAEHTALAQADIVATWDFYYDDPVVWNEAPDSSNQDHHGTSTLGCIAAWAPYNLIGAAYDASFALAKTEHIDEEVNAEEDDFVAGLEWLDSLGVDIASASLGYSLFDDGEHDYTIEDLNGDICITTVACDLAAERGIFMVNSAGNSGSTHDIWHGRVTSPADGDSVMAVGAVYPDSSLVPFSSRGPTWDGRIKPDFVAMGAETWVIDTNPGMPIYRNGYGTSYSAPLFAGGVALLLQVEPRLLPLPLAELMKQYASHNAAPDTAFGWGLVDLPRVVEHLRANMPQLAGKEICVFPNPFNNSLSFLIDSYADYNPELQIKLYDILGRLRYTHECNGVQHEEGLLVTLPVPAWLANGIYFAELMRTDTGVLVGRRKCLKLEL